MLNRRQTLKLTASWIVSKSVALTSLIRTSNVRSVDLWLKLIVVGCVGSVVWVVNTETMAIYAGSEGMHPLLVGAYCSLGQNVSYLFLYRGGDWLIRRWGWLQRKIRGISAKLTDASSRRFCAFTVVAALFGVPPIVGMVTLAPAFHVSLGRILTITIPCRAIRFSVLAAFGTAITDELRSMLSWLGLG